MPLLKLLFGPCCLVLLINSGGGAATAVLMDSDLGWSRSQGEVGLTTMDAGYDFGMVPDWLVSQRLKNLVYPWPIDTFFS